MPQRPLNPRELGRYYALAQIGMEMVVPVAAGIALDYYLGWTPWGAVGGAVLGLVGGMAHLITIVNQRNGSGSSDSRRNEQ